MSNMAIKDEELIKRIMDLMAKQPQLAGILDEVIESITRLNNIANKQNPHRITRRPIKSLPLAIIKLIPTGRDVYMNELTTIVLKSYPDIPVKKIRNMMQYFYVRNWVDRVAYGVYRVNDNAPRDTQ